MTQALTINDVRIEPHKITLGTYGSVGVDRIAFVFSGEWEELLTKATFYPVYGSPVEMLASGEVIVPPEMYKKPGVGKLVVSGYAIENNTLKKRKYTIPCEMEIPNTIIRKGENSIPETPDLYEQLRAQLRDDIFTALQNAKDSGEFDGKDGRDGKDGANGVDGKDGADGKAATVDVARTETLASGENAFVRNEGTNSNARFVFGIPRGEQGETGERGGSGVYVLGDGETEDNIPVDAEVALFPVSDSLQILDGRGIVSIVRTTGNGNPGSTDTYTIHYTDKTTSYFTVYNGKDGAGFKPIGFKASVNELPTSANPGEAYFVGTDSPYDVYVWSGAEWKNIGAINGIKGEAGRGIVSIIRTTGDGSPGSTDTYTIHYSDTTTSDFTVYNGQDGAKGDPGAQGVPGAKGADGKNGRGIVSIERTDGNGAAGTVDTYTIHYSDATTSTFPVYNGADGNGADITIDSTVTQTGANAVSGAAVYNYVSGVMGDFNSAALQMEALIGG